MRDAESRPADGSSLAREALSYLCEQLGPRAPRCVTFEAAFAEAPLEDEGPATVFSFELPDLAAAPGGPEATYGFAPPCGDAPTRHYAVVGRTQPNYFPSYGLDADDAYSLHVGTRFMLEMQIGLADPADEPPQARAAMRGRIAAAGDAVRVEDESLAALFRNGDQLYAVYRLRLAPGPDASASADVYCMGADCPPGFYSLTEHPPQVALRLHLGKLIRLERG